MAVVTETTRVHINIDAAITATALPKDFWMDLPVFPSDISEQVREIYQRGLLMGNNPHAFSKIGDCNSTTPYFLSDFDLGNNSYQLGGYAYLQPTIDYFNGSFGRISLAAKQGMSTAGELASLWTDWKQCSNNETPLDCEIRLHHPSFAIVSLGTNEAYDVKRDRSSFEGRLRRIIEHLIDQGVVPILSTKADNDEGDNFINSTTARLALEYGLPLWNFWRAVQSLPLHGMRSSDHLTFAFTKSYADFSNPEYLEYGMQMRNLTALEVLDVIRREFTQPRQTFTPTPFASATPAAVSVPQAGDTLVSSMDGMESLYIPSGSFNMGSLSGKSDTVPIHIVQLDGFWMDDIEVTNRMFAAFLNANGNQIEGGTYWLTVQSPAVQVVEKNGSWQVRSGKENYPIVEVSWFGANAYCQWVGRRLPTEAEWEYVAKGVDDRRFPWGNDGLSCDRARYLGCGKGTVAAGSLEAGMSPFGIFDMAGNVAEWLSDRYANDYYHISPLLNPQGPSNGYYRVIRGGSWESNYLHLQTTYRDWAGADQHDPGVGFRCAFTSN